LFISGVGFDRGVLQAARDAGVTQFAASLDGPPAIHDRLRPPRAGLALSAFEAAEKAIGLLVESEAPVRVVTQVNRLNAGELEWIYRQLVAWGVRQWQVHLCQMTGRAAERRGELTPDPLDLEEIVRVLLLAAQEKQVTAPLHCTVGYLTPEEPVLRNRERAGTPVWQGCDAARRTLAVTPLGGVKGCTALPDEFVVASLRDRTLADIWADDDCFPYARRWSRTMLADLCAACRFGDACRAGCPAVAYGVAGAIGANPFCLRIARQL
jgi:radical SAM protein with 4Fe4S-binding SPASM domain